MKQKIILLLAAVLIGSFTLFCIFIFPSNERNTSAPTSFSSIASRTEEEVLRDSELILEGTVVGQEQSRWSNPGFSRGDNIRNIPQTDYIIQIDRFLYGTYEKDQVAVRVNTNDSAYQFSTGDGKPFAPGNQVLLFLSRDSSDVATNEDYFVETFLGYGIYLEQGGLYVNQRTPNQTYQINALRQKIQAMQQE